MPKIEEFPFEIEIRENGFEQVLGYWRDYFLRRWRGENWVLHFNSSFRGKSIVHEMCNPFQMRHLSE